MGVASSDIKFGVQFTTLGTIPITEYGTVIVTRVATDPDNTIPDLNDEKLILSISPDLLPHFESGFFGNTLFPPKKLIFRAYALYGNGSVVFGEAKTIFTDKPIL